MNCASGSTILRHRALRLASGAVFLALGALAACRAVQGEQVTWPVRVTQKATFELALADVPMVRNPYDPEQVFVEAVFRAPSGHLQRVPGFFFAGHDAIFDVPTHAAGWRLRFTPEEVGRYEAELFVGEGDKPPRLLASGSFESIASDHRGFVRRAPPPGRYLERDGQVILLLGQNLCWGSRDDPAVYLEQLDQVAAAGANCVRIWLAPWFLPLEGYGEGLQRGPGRYDPRASALLDAILRRCEARGLCVILCLEQHGNFQPAGGETGLWPRHPYNRANGGPCDSVRDFFVNAEARRLFRQKLRYLIARYGASTALLGWELFNEVELMPFEAGTFGDHLPAILDWHRQMSAFLRSEDPYRHLVLTSADEAMQRELLLAGAIDAVQLHVYAEEELEAEIARRVRSAAQRCGAPVLVGEYGARRRGSALGLARGIWAALGAGAVGALPWNDGHGCLEGMPAAWAAMRVFMQTSRASLRAATVLAATDISTGEQGADERFEDVVIRPPLGFAEERPGALLVLPDGTLSGRGQLSRFLRPEDGRGRRPAYILDVNFPREGQLGILVHRVSDLGILEVFVDGERVGSVRLLTGPNNPKAKESKWNSQWQIYQDVYDREFFFPMPAGRHRVRIENVGKDWVEIPQLRLVGYRLVQESPGEVFATGSREEAWAYIIRGRSQRTRARIRFTIADFVRGTYRVQWWSCAAGRGVAEDVVQAAAGGLRLQTPLFAEDLAAHITRID